MDLRDFLSIFATVLSILSLGLAVFNFRFGRRVKLLELKSSLNAKAVELLVRAMSLASTLKEIRVDAELAGETELAAQVPVKNATENLEEIRELHASVAELSLQNVFKAHDTVFSSIHKISEVMSELERDALRTRGRLEQLTSLKKTISKGGD